MDFCKDCKKRSSCKEPCDIVEEWLSDGTNKGREKIVSPDKIDYLAYKKNPNIFDDESLADEIKEAEYPSLDLRRMLRQDPIDLTSKELFILHLFLDYAPHRQIAENLGCSHPNITQRLKRIEAKLVKSYQNCL